MKRKKRKKYQIKENQVFSCIMFYRSREGISSWKRNSVKGVIWKKVMYEKEKKKENRISKDVSNTNILIFTS